MPRTDRRQTKAGLEARISDLVADLLAHDEQIRGLLDTVSRDEAELARCDERIRSLEVLLERAEADRDRALQRLSSCSYELGAARHRLAQIRALEVSDVSS